MKSFIVFVSLFVSLLASLTAGARSIHPLTWSLTANLTNNMFIDQDSYLNEMNIVGGRVEIKQLKKEIALQLHIAPQCEEGFACIEILQVEEIKLPIKQQFTDNCNNTTFVAIRDMMPADGTRQVLRVTDHTYNRCPTFQALPETGISYNVSYYDRLNGGMKTIHHTFEAEKLKGQYLPVILPAIAEK